jgi:urease accessory protein
MDEEYLLLLLADSNLPTGSFVASSGLESYLKHGFSSLSPESTIVAFITDSLASYARSTLPFVSDAHHLVALAREQSRGEGELNQVLKDLMELDHLYNSMTLNHVARRASKAQGVALLTLYAKGFARSSSLSAFTDSEPHHHETAMNRLFSQFKLSVRKEEVDGHLPTCWGALTAALGLALGAHNYYLKEQSFNPVKSHRSGSVSSSLPPCKESSFRLRAPQCHWTIQCSTDLIARSPSSDNSRG